MEIRYIYLASFQGAPITATTLAQRDVRAPEVVSVARLRQNRSHYAAKERIANPEQTRYV